MPSTALSILFLLKGCLALSLVSALPQGAGQAVRQGGSALADCSLNQVEGNRAYKESEGRLPEHRIGRNDVLGVTVWNGADLQESKIKVAEDGTIFVPFGLNENLLVEGCTSSELKRGILESLTRYYRSPQVQVVIDSYQSKRAYLLGTVRWGTGRGPGLWPLAGKKRILEFITENGGFTENSNLTAVQLNRASGEVLRLNLSDVIFRGDLDQNPVVDDGDIVWVPPKEVGSNTYYLFGEVRNPGVVISETPLTVVDAISKAGSLTRDAAQKGIFLVRGDLNEPHVVQLNLKKLFRHADLSQNAVLEDHDILFVAKSPGTKMRDVMAIISPIIGVIRDAVFLREVTRDN